MRDPDLQRFIDATEAAFRDRMPAGTAIEALADHVFSAIAEAGDQVAGEVDAETLPVCRYLAPALVTAATGSPRTAAVAEAFSHLAPRLRWGRRPAGPDDAPGFADSHANTVLLGEGGLEQRDDVRIGVSLVAPDMTYPDHTHPPEEMYLVLSPGDWRNAEANWHSPGVGGLVHNPPGIVHAMRSGGAPLFAIWCLWSPA